MLKVCKVKGCCIDTKYTNEISSSKTVTISLDVVHELLRMAYRGPGMAMRLTNATFDYFRTKPKMPSWDIQTTLIMTLLQELKDGSVNHGLFFWRMSLNIIRFAYPLQAYIKPESVIVKTRGFDGLLRLMDQQEHAPLDAEWVSTSEHIEQANEKIVLYIHGGGFCTMSAQTHRVLTYKIAKSTGRRVLAVNYRLAPETKFPGALYDVIQTFLYLIEQGYKANNIMIMGDSAGGCLCMTMMLYLRDHGMVMPEGAVLLSASSEIYPFVDLTFSYASWQDKALQDYVPKPTELTAFNPIAFYLESNDLAVNPYVSPIFAENFDYFPPVLIQSGGCESLRDEIIDLATKMSQSKGSCVRHEIYQDMAHVFQAFPFVKSSTAVDNVGVWLNNKKTDCSIVHI